LPALGPPPQPDQRHQPHDQSIEQVDLTLVLGARLGDGAELVELVRQRIGPVASFKIAVLVRRLPKTRSGKIVRGTIKKIADGDPYRIPATIDDPAILDEITADLASIGYPKERP
jgi:AMP-binding enzyme